MLLSSSSSLLKSWLRLSARRELRGEKLHVCRGKNFKSTVLKDVSRSECEAANQGTLRKWSHWKAAFAQRATIKKPNSPAAAERPRRRFCCGLTASNVHEWFASCLCCCTDFTLVNFEFLLLTFKQTSEQAAQSFCRCCFKGRTSNVGCAPESSSARLSVRLD